jgi:uncharacterized lipoprotein YmbA
MTGMRWLNAWMLIALSACAANPPTRMFLLNPPHQHAVAAGGPTLGPIQLQRVVVPDYLDVESILVRAEQHEVKALPGAQWAERLSSGITRALNATLAERLPEYSLESARPIDARALQIVVDVESMDLLRDGRCLIGASWSILEPRTGKVLRSGRFESVGSSRGARVEADAAALVAAAAAAINELADELVRAVRSGG